MINKFDTGEIAAHVADVLRTKMSHRSVEMSGSDYEEILNFVSQVVSKYEDNKHVLDTQLNPHTGKAEVVDVKANK